MARASTGLAYAALGISVVGGLVFSVFVSVPQWKNWRDKLVELDADRQIVDEKTAFLANIDNRAEDLKRYENESKALTVAFPNTIAPSDITAIISAFSARNSVSVMKISAPKTEQTVAQPPSPAGAGGPGTATSGASAPETVSQKYVVDITVDGTYAALSAFIRDLERSPRLFDISKVTFGKLQDSLSANISLTAYVVQDSGTLPGSTAGAGAPGAGGPGGVPVPPVQRSFP